MKGNITEGKFDQQGPNQLESKTKYIDDRISSEAGKTDEQIQDEGEKDHEKKVIFYADDINMIIS